MTDIKTILASYKQWKSDRRIGDAADPLTYLEMVMAELSQIDQPDEVATISQHHLGQLRHAYSQLNAGTVKDQKAFANGLIAPVIRAIEKSQPDPTIPRNLRDNPSFPAYSGKPWPMLADLRKATSANRLPIHLLRQLFVDMWGTVLATVSEDGVVAGNEIAAIMESFNIAVDFEERTWLQCYASTEINRHGDRAQ